MTKTNFEQLSESNIDFFESAKKSLLDPLGINLANDVKWIKLNENWNSLKFPVVVGGKGPPILLLHGFDSSFLEFRRIYQSLKRNFQVIIPDLLGFGFSPRCATDEYNPSRIISFLIDILKNLKITNNLKIIGASMGGSTALKLSFEITDSVDKIILLSPAGLYGEPKSIPFPLNQIGAFFLGLPQVRKSLCRQAFAFPDECVGEMEEQIASIHLGCKGWRNSLASFAKSGGFAGTHKYIKNIPIKAVCGENDRILGKNEIKNIRKIDKLNLVELQNCGHLPHVDLPSLTSKIIEDYFLL
ncbi:putative alpha/beta hydrolase [Prochlorococcus marinus str. MIT 9321]|uniref:Putative alpha/beta hydrolase n=1 Tax=Prochlorococcus marinus str. MIT 9401 TaxID=167551 RepID=A0A0A2BCV7_PROMR|nr:alpha/beta hydrolase [Prochlorococcus marinus]KGG05898.1 putative alpha/beta hydrolase [Prochlorococcus marinus str. MIT 9322]KGG05967.1 putative alpha/beta hydrolase [Prochlorococcus marinus str. MIT 9321]KGG10997.1 putative alpha/beta hydrolase [Prochlorococcus marinus str. MIT 9401]